MRRAVHGPYIMFSSPKARKYEQRCKKIGDRTSPEYKKASLKAKKLNLSERQKVLEWLNGFYEQRDTPHSQRLTIMEMSHEVSYLYCQSACMAPLLPAAGRKKLLQTNQAEMQAFTDYLVASFFKK